MLQVQDTCERPVRIGLRLCGNSRDFSWLRIFCGLLRTGSIYRRHCRPLGLRGAEIGVLCACRRLILADRLGSGRNGGQKSPNPDQGDHALDVIGEHVECHLGAHVSEPAHPEVRRAHPGLDRAERVLDSRAAQTHQGGGRKRALAQQSWTSALPGFIPVPNPARGRCHDLAVVESQKPQ